MPMVNAKDQLLNREKKILSVAPMMDKQEN